MESNDSYEEKEIDAEFIMKMIDNVVSVKEQQIIDLQKNINNIIYATKHFIENFDKTISELDDDTISLKTIQSYESLKALIGEQSI